MEVRKRFENDKLKKLQIFNGAQLKYIAFISMLIDHVNNALITPFLNGKGFLLHLSNLFSILGRIAFPIFVFFIVEGFFKTSNRKKYLITLLLFGVISEVPFDMFTSKVFFDPYWNNIMFTLALCLITIWIIDAVKEKISNKVLWYSISIVIVGISCAVAMALSLVVCIPSSRQLKKYKIFVLPGCISGNIFMPPIVAFHEIPLVLRLQALSVAGRLYSNLYIL